MVAVFKVGIGVTLILRLPAKFDFTRDDFCELLQ